MKVPLLSLKPGDRFKYDGVSMVRVANKGRANAGDLEIHQFVVLPFDAMVDVPPYEPDYTPTSDEIAEQAELDAKGLSMTDRIRMGEFDDPLEKEQWKDERRKWIGRGFKPSE